MSQPYHKLKYKRFAPQQGLKTAENKYWNKFKNPIVTKEYASVTHIEFMPNQPYDYVVSSSTRVQVYDSITHTVKKTISRFKDTAYSGHIRPDGKLLVAGDATGLVQVFDLLSRSALRSFERHTDPVRATKFSRQNAQHVLSGSDDNTICLWDISSSEPLLHLTEHKDYVRSLDWSYTSNSNLCLSGSYDHTVKLWDVRVSSKTAVMNFEHTRPVESVLFCPNNSTAVSASGTTLSLWDLSMGNKALQQSSNHQKTITGMCFDSSHSRVLTCSLDEHVKVFDIQTFGVTHTFKYTEPLLSVALSPNNNSLCVGSVQGILSVRQKIVSASEVSKRKHMSVASKHFLRGLDYQPVIHATASRSSALPVQLPLKLEDAVVIKGSGNRAQRLTVQDKLLKKFQYAEALDVVLRKPVDAKLVITMIEELVHQDAVRTALKNRDDHQLKPILEFLVKNVTNPNYTSVLLDFAELLLDMYGNLLGLSSEIENLCRHLRYNLNQELALQRTLYKILGQLDLLGGLGHSFSIPL